MEWIIGFMVSRIGLWYARDTGRKEGQNLLILASWVFFAGMFITGLTYLLQGVLWLVGLVS